MNSNRPTFGSRFFRPVAQFLACGTLALGLSSSAFAVSPRVAHSRSEGPALAPASTATPGEFAPHVTTADTSRPLSGREVYQRLLLSTCQVAHDEGTGTGWIIDKDRRLIVTNQHVVSDHERVELIFPEYEDGHVITDTIHYENDVRRVSGVVLDADFGLDLALIQADHIPDGMVTLPLADESTMAGDDLYTLGANPEGSKGYWNLVFGKARNVFPSTTNSGGYAMILESDMEINHGNSGGPIVDDHGRLVGVVEGWTLLVFERPDHSSISGNDTPFGIDVATVREWRETVSPLVAPQTSEQFTARGVRHLSQGRVEQSIADFSHARQLDPKNADALYHRGEAFMALGDDQAALLDAADMLRLDAGNPLGYQLRGVIYEHQGNHTAAINDLTQAIRLSGSSEKLHEAYFLRGQAFLGAGQSADALADLGRAQTLAERQLATLGTAHSTGDQQQHNDVLFRLKRYYYVSGVLHRELGQPQDAVNDLEKSLNVKDPQTFAMYGLALYDAGDFKTAYGAHTVAINLYNYLAWEDNAELHFYRGRDLLRLGEYQMAGDDFRTAIGLDDGVAVYWLGLAIAEENLGHAEVARQYKQRASELDSAIAGGEGEQQSNAASPVVGRWHYHGDIDGTNYAIDVQINADGTYSYIQQTYNGREWNVTYREAGNYTLSGDTIRMTDTEGNVYVYQYNFENDLFWVDLSNEYGYWIGFAAK